MEHRWGERIELDLPVRLNIQSRRVARGQILNVSLSGAFVATSEHVPSQATVSVEFSLMRSRSRKPHRVPAYVVRRTESGIALEWREFAPSAIRALIALTHAGLIGKTRAKRQPVSDPPSHSQRHHEPPADCPAGRRAWSVTARPRSRQ